MTKEEKIELSEQLYKKGVSINEIAERLDCSASSVGKYISELGLRPKRAKGLDEQVLRLKTRGYNMVQIAYELECSQSYVRDALIKAGYVFGHYTKYEENLITADTVYATDWNARPLEKLTIKDKWRVEKGVMKRLIHHYTDITPIFSPR